MFVRSGIFGSKSKNIPYNFNVEFTYQNEYLTKSEKIRHEKLINELVKLEEFIEKNPEKENLIIKDFMLKYKIENIKNYNLKYLKNVLNKNYLKLNPEKNIKNMIIDILNSKDDFNKSDFFYKKYVNKFFINNENNKNNIKNKKIPFNFFDKFNLNQQKKSKIIYKEKNYSEDFNLIINDISKEIQDFNEKYEKKNNSIVIKNNKNKTNDFNFETSIKKNISNDFIKKLSKPNLNEINQRLYYKPLYKPISHDDIKKAQKLTEFVTYNFALNNLFFKKNGIN